MDNRDPLDIDYLRTQLIANGPYQRIEYFPEVSSTNTAGRGRMGRSFSAPPRSQMPLSILIRPPHESVTRLGTMPLATGLALIDALATPQIQLKWPNDLVIDGRKLCGILAEAVSLGDQPAVVIGLGLNTSLTKEELPVPHATSLHLEGIPYERNELAVRVLNALHHRLTQWETNDPALMPDYRAVSATIGQNVRVILPNDTELLGTAEGVADDGRLQVRDQTGTLHELTAGDVTHLRLQ